MAKQLLSIQLLFLVTTITAGLQQILEVPLLSPSLNKIEDQNKYSAAERISCNENYSPCYCSTDSNGNIYIACELFCDKDGYYKEIQKVFRRTTDLEIFQIQLLPQGGCKYYTTTLPADLLSDKLFTEILVGDHQTVYNSGLAKMVFDPSVFRATQNYTTKIALKHLDFYAQRDMNFLSGFSKLKYLFIVDYVNFEAFEYLPPLQSLSSLFINSCKISSKCLRTFPDITPAKLEYLSLLENYLDDQAANLILSLVANSSSFNSIHYIDISKNNLTSIPAKISSFVNLNHLDLQENKIALIPTDSLTFTAPVIHVNLNRQLFLETKIGITNEFTDQVRASGTLTIEKNAFKGNFTMAKMYLTQDTYSSQSDDQDGLTLFEEDVFKEMLEQMVSVHPPVGMVYVEENPFVCGCDLAWLIRHNRHLLTVVYGGVCWNGTRFQDLDPELFSDCPYNLSSTSTTLSSTTSTESENNSAISYTKTGDILSIILLPIFLLSFFMEEYPFKSL